ncbi:DUF3883 domain-containing protein [Thalassospira alkalitolerans]|uniref:DUF3883 domain-containing protein n=1 Tax=Thalassospira alkalitolerans TaxID=1293890 RepID=UPI003AA943BD
MAKVSWTNQENDLIVADYFAMLSDELARVPYNKAAHRRALLPDLNSRSEGSVEFKHQNISAVLKALGQPWIQGYKPAFNFQMSLVDAVARHLEQKPLWQPKDVRKSERPGCSEATSLWIAHPPTLSNQPEPKELEQTQAVARAFDVAGRDERNRALGEAGERLAFSHEKAILLAAGKQDLAQEVRWVSKEEGDGAGYDIRSFEPNGRPRLIEVKTTTGWERTPFHISRNELEVSKVERENWTLLRIWNFAREPRAFELRPPLEAHVSLTATSYRAAIH